jgi:CRISPR-associated protein Csm4
MHLLLLRCRDGAQFHLGETSLEDSSELLHADTLFSALANLYALAYGAAEEWIAHVREGRVRLSSGLHCVELPGREEPLYFVPLPPLRYAVAGADDETARRLRRVRYVSLGLLERIRAGLAADDAGDELPRCALDVLAFPRIAGGYACTEEEMEPLGGVLPEEPFAVVTSRPRLERRTLTVEDSFYHATALSFAPVPLGAGGVLRGHFYVLVDHSLDGDAWRRFVACARLMADEGVGGERSSGYGAVVETELREAPAGFSRGAHAVSLTLSPTVPADDDELSRALYYRLFLRGGGSLGLHGDADLHRRRVRMMREGALFRGRVGGRLVDVSPPRNERGHPVLRSGFAFNLGLGVP